jgi:hypothetical protein
MCFDVCPKGSHAKALSDFSPTLRKFVRDRDFAAATYAGQVAAGDVKISNVLLRFREGAAPSLSECSPQLSRKGEPPTF